MTVIAPAFPSVPLTLPPPIAGDNGPGHLKDWTSQIQRDSYSIKRSPGRHRVAAQVLSVAETEVGRACPRGRAGLALISLTRRSRADRVGDHVLVGRDGCCPGTVEQQSRSRRPRCRRGRGAAASPSIDTWATPSAMTQHSPDDVPSLQIASPASKAIGSPSTRGRRASARVHSGKKRTRAKNRSTRSSRSAPPGRGLASRVAIGGPPRVVLSSDRSIIPFVGRRVARFAADQGGEAPHPLGLGLRVTAFGGRDAAPRSEARAAGAPLVPRKRAGWSGSTTPAKRPNKPRAAWSTSARAR